MWCKPCLSLSMLSHPIWYLLLVTADLTHCNPPDHLLHALISCLKIKYPLKAMCCQLYFIHFDAGKNTAEVLEFKPAGPAAGHFAQYARQSCSRELWAGMGWQFACQAWRFYVPSGSAWEKVLIDMSVRLLSCVQSLCLGHCSIAQVTLERVAVIMQSSPSLISEWAYHS